MVEIKFSPAAVKDLQETKTYIVEELCNEQAALGVMARILKCIHQLEAFPLSGAPLSGVVGFDTDYRFLVCGNYTVFYRFENHTVFITRVLYGRRDFIRILFGDLPDEKGS